jgi:hypothetical protein
MTTLNPTSTLALGYNTTEFRNNGGEPGGEEEKNLCQATVGIS